MNEPIKSRHAELLNRLAEMQLAPYYATARATLGQAEKAIVDLEGEVRVSDQLLAQRDRLLDAIPGCDAHGSRCIPHAIEWVGAAASAFEIADEAMFELIVSHGVWAAGADDRCAMQAEDGEEVSTIAEAESAIRDAFAWLQPRGYVELGKDESGEFIRVLRRP